MSGWLLISALLLALRRLACGGRGWLRGCADRCRSGRRCPPSQHRSASSSGSCHFVMQRGRGHALPRLTPAALHDVVLDPRVDDRAPDPDRTRGLRSSGPPCLSAYSIGNAHARVALCPSTCSVQAPQSARPHPNLVPVIFRVSRSTQSSGVSPGTSTWRAAPLSVNSTFIGSSPSSAWGSGWSRPCPATPPRSAIQVLNALMNSACGIGIGSRPRPGFQPHRTSASCSMCSSTFCSERLPVRLGSLSASARPWSSSPSQPIERGASDQCGAPGTPARSWFFERWHAPQVMPGRPRFMRPRCTFLRVDLRLVADPRPVAGRVAVQAARVPEHFRNLLERRDGFRLGALFLRFRPAHIDRQYARDQNRERQHPSTGAPHPFSSMCRPIATEPS